MKNCAELVNAYVNTHKLGANCQTDFVFELASKMGLELDGRPIYLIAHFAGAETPARWKKTASFEDVLEMVVNQLMSKSFGCWEGFDFIGFEERTYAPSRLVDFSTIEAGLEVGFIESEKTNF